MLANHETQGDRLAGANVIGQGIQADDHPTAGQGNRSRE
jgi:hypothetical protein